MNAKTCRPTPNYWTALNVEQGASRQKITAAYKKMSATMHPDKGGDEKVWALITAAFNALKDPNHMWGQNGDSSWQRDYVAATAKPKTDAPKAGRPKTSKAPEGWTFEERDGEIKEDRRRRYAREYQAARYAADPDFAKARREASKRCNDKKAAARKASKSAPAAA